MLDGCAYTALHDLGIGEHAMHVVDVTDWDISRFELGHPMGGRLTRKDRP
ncbi:hypothetical protein I553_5127 [Mycobacterium xenopi 4042]|uniref:Uncharacterized protein n=1 Tax=Mycobacterium xenopi 4042 TaxID=1299334 RepID=X7ZUS5_MYCXE|nr:hypothetical protein I553_5127 [Mycobacterium xenopi 4042]